MTGDPAKSTWAYLAAFAVAWSLLAFFSFERFSSKNDVLSLFISVAFFSAALYMFYRMMEKWLRWRTKGRAERDSRLS